MIGKDLVTQLEDLQPARRVKALKDCHEALKTILNAAKREQARTVGGFESSRTGDQRKSKRKRSSSTADPSPGRSALMQPVHPAVSSQLKMPAMQHLRKAEDGMAQSVSQPNLVRLTLKLTICFRFYVTPPYL